MPRKSSTVNDEDMFPEIEPMELSDAPATSKKRKRSATKDRNATEDTSDVDVEGVSGDENGQEEQEEQEEEDEEEEEEEDEAERQRKTKKARRAERAGKKRKHREVEEQENDEDAVGEGDAGEDMMVQGVTQEMRDMMETVDETKKCGLIETVELEDFMCHHAYSITFGERVNFVTGNNGSGKSSILTAIVVCLGGKTTTTGRGTAMKDLIKRGKEKAVVRIWLSNKGLEPFKYDVYGSSVIIERTIRSNGSSSYRMCNGETRHLVSKEKNELNSILDFFSIQVENPVAVLTQDTSRQFLSGTSSKDKYKFFMLATDLEKINNHFAAAVTHKEEALEMVNSKKRLLDGMTANVEQLRRKYEATQTARKLTRHLAEKEAERLWALVRDKEVEIEAKNVELEKAQSKMQEYDEKVEKLLGDIEKVRAKHTQNTTPVLSYTERCAEARKEQEGLDRAAAHAKEMVSRAREGLRDIGGRIDELRSEKRAVESQIAEIQGRDTGREARERQERLQRKQHQLEDVDANVRQARKTESDLQNALMRLEQAQEELKRVTRSHRGEATAIDTALRAMQVQSQDKMAAYGKYTSRLLAAIKNTRGWRREPIGPAGMFVSVPNQEHVEAVEALTHASLSKFCVDNTADYGLLQRVFAQVIPNKHEYPQVVIRKFERRFQLPDVPHGLGVPTIMELIQCDNEIVFNMLVDAHSIHHVAYVEDAVAKMQFMRQCRNRHVKSAYDRQGGQATKTGASYAPSHSGARVLKGFSDGDIRQEKTRLEQAKQKEHAAAEEERANEKVLMAKDRAMKEASRTIQVEQRKHEKLMKEIRELQLEDDGGGEADVSGLVAELENTVNRIAALEEEEREQKGRVHETQLAYERAHGAKTEGKQQAKILVEKLSTLTEKQMELEADVKRLNDELTKVRAKMNQYSGNAAATTREMTELRGELKVRLTEAEEGSMDEEGTRVETRQSVTSIESEILKLRKRIRKEQKGHEDCELIKRNYLQEREKLESIVSTIAHVENDMKKLEAVLMKRLASVRSIRQMKSSQVRGVFSAMLDQRQFSGKIVMDHRNKTLELKLNPNASEKTHREDLRSLSGGERSYSTVCFVVALWRAMESPFRILDEFDVFMDMINRRISLNVLINYAKAFRHQVILISPLGERNVEDGETEPELIKVFELKKLQDRD